MNALFKTPVDKPDNLERILAESSACLLLASSACTEPIEQPVMLHLAGTLLVEPAGFEPATSCLQRALAAKIKAHN
jgi:hypothetical protein